MSPAERSRSIARINAAMAIPALTGLGAAILVYGLLVGPPWDAWLTGLQFACVAAFTALQLSKLAVVEHPLGYLRSHGLDFSMLVILAAQILVYLGLAQSDEAAYLAAHHVPDPTWALLVLVVQFYFLAIVAARSALANQLLLRLRLAPAQMAVVSFGLLVAAGTLALLLPGCRRDGSAVACRRALHRDLGGLRDGARRRRHGRAVLEAGVRGAAGADPGRRARRADADHGLRGLRRAALHRAPRAGPGRGDRRR